MVRGAKARLSPSEMPLPGVSSNWLCRALGAAPLEGVTRSGAEGGMSIGVRYPKVGNRNSALQREAFVIKQVQCGGRQ